MKLKAAPRVSANFYLSIAVSALAFAIFVVIVAIAAEHAVTDALHSVGL